MPQPIHLVALALLALSLQRAPAQVLQISGGTSSLDQSHGAQLTLRARTYSATAGAGTIGGQFFAGGRVSKAFEHSTLTLGTADIPFDLPTDVFATGHYLTVLGLGYRFADDSQHTYLFAGATATGFNSPFFNASQPSHGAALLQHADTLDEHWSATTLLLYAQSFTLLQSFDRRSASGATRWAVTAGFGSGHPYAATSFTLHRPRYDLDASYITASGDFRRVEVKSPLNAEPNRENIQFVLRPFKDAGITVSRQNFLSPIYLSTANTRSSIDQVTANARVAGIQLAGTISQSTFATGKNRASFYSAGRAFGSGSHAQVAYLISRPQSSPGEQASTASFIATVQQAVTPRWTVNVALNSSGGQNTLGLGGAFLSNLATLSADYQTFYVPARTDAPFQRALILNAQVHLFGRATLNASTFLAPDGRLLSTTSGEATLTHGAGPAPPTRVVLGANVLRGRVLVISGKDNPNGPQNPQPVPGAALLIDQMPVYTDSTGRFIVRERKPHRHAIDILTTQFLEGGLYRVVSAPTFALSTADPTHEELILVEKIPLPSARLPLPKVRP